MLFNYHCSQYRPSIKWFDQFELYSLHKLIQMKVKSNWYRMFPLSNVLCQYFRAICTGQAPHPAIQSVYSKCVNSPNIWMISHFVPFCCNFLRKIWTQKNDQLHFQFNICYQINNCQIIYQINWIAIQIQYK